MEQLDIFDIEESGTEAGGKRPKDRGIRRPVRMFFAAGFLVILGLVGAVFLLPSRQAPPLVGQRLHKATFPIAITEQTASAPQSMPSAVPPESKPEFISEPIPETPPEIVSSPEVAPAPQASPVPPDISPGKRDDTGIPPSDYTHLVRGSALKKAAEAYRKDLIGHGSFFTLRLEVNCKTESVLLAFQKGSYSPAMFILPREVEGKPCWAVMWGIYASRSDAMNGYDSLPPSFKVEKPGALIAGLKPYLE